MKKLFGISTLTITCLYGLLAGIIILVVLLTGGDVLIAIGASLVILFVQFLISPWITDVTMKWFYGAKFGGEIPEYLEEFITEVCKKHDIKYPKIGFIDDGGPNAFTYGRTKKDARIVFTRGILELLKEDEVKAVVGHELGHIAHRDMMVMTFAQAVPLILYAIYEACTRMDSGSDNKNSGKLAAVGLIAYLLYIVSEYIILWLSRTREYYADEFAVDELKNPAALAEALVKIGFGLATKSTATKHDVSKKNALGIFDKGASKAMSIASMDEKGISKDRIKKAMKWEMWNPWAKWFEFNSTHPLISKRLQAISKKSKEYNQKPYIEFDLKKPESYVDDFLLEVLIAFLPTLSFIISLVLVIILIVSEANINMYFVIGICCLVMLLFSFIKFKRAHKKQYKETTVEDLLGEVKVSHITSVPCIIKGEIIGKGNPGCIFNEDFIVKDETGIMFLDYNQPLWIINKIFALFKSKEYFNKIVEVKGWYRRSPVPYVEIYEYTIDGKVKKIFTYGLTIGLYVVWLAISLGLILFGLM